MLQQAGGAGDRPVQERESLHARRRRARDFVRLDVLKGGMTTSWKGGSTTDRATKTKTSTGGTRRTKKMTTDGSTIEGTAAAAARTVLYHSFRWLCKLLGRGRANS